MSKRADKFLKTLQIIEKHLGKNEKWFQKPEEKMTKIDKEMDDWNNQFLKNIGTFEKIMKEFQKRME